MLTRFRYRRDFRGFIRYLSDKTNDGDQPESNNAKPNKEEKKTESTPSIMNTKKIQALLQNMKIESKIKNSEYREQFTTAPDVKKLRKQAADEIEVKTEQIEKSITEAAGKVAEALGGDVKQTEAELLSKVLGKINQSSTNLSDLLLGMKVDRSKDKDDLVPETRGQQVKRLVGKAKADNQIHTRKYVPRKDIPQGRPSKSNLQPATVVDGFSGKPSNMFTNKEVDFGTKLDVWESLKQRELELATTQPPGNYFQKMSLWTKQGKIWKFPIDNEQGISEEEQSIHFSEHIFLDAHLEDWCPSRGPIRHFMELVCVGLSKNPFYTVQEKKDHIMWYKDYFESKKDVLVEIGAWEKAATSSEAKL